jgi:hypothetical protein
LTLVSSDRLSPRPFLLPQCYNPAFLSPSDVQVYVSAFSRAGKMHAGFELYRAFETDHVEMKDALASQGQMTMPVLSTGGKESGFTVPVSF